MRHHTPCERCGHRADYHNAFGTMPCAACDCDRLRVATPSAPGVKSPSPPRPVVAVKPERWRADARAIRRHAMEVINQCDFYLQNGSGDEMRFCFISSYARKAALLAARADARQKREYEARAGKGEVEG